MKIFLFVFLLFLSLSQLFAQNENATLLVQSPDGKTVKLAWSLKSWSSNITGFDIKRKEGLEDWVKLNSEPILPGVSSKKELSIVDANKNEENALKARLYKLLATHKLQEVDYAAFLQKLNSDNNALKDLSNSIAHDYDIALMSGFAYVDHSVSKKTGYQYGLFIQGTDKLLAKVSWNYGEIPDLNAVREITSLSKIKSNGIQVIWNADTIKMKATSIAGFNIYRQGIRLNATPIQSVSSEDPSEFTWYDKSASTSTGVQYSISAESIFGIEGIIKPYTYNPVDHPQQYKKAEVTEVTSLGYYFKDGIDVKWAFPKDFERFLKGYYVEKNNFPDGYKRVSSLIDPTTREFIDKSSSPVSGYVSFRVTALYNDRTAIAGIEKIYTYFPVREPPQPQNVTFKSVLGDKKVTIFLSWDNPMSGDTVTDYYKVYATDPSNNKLSAVTEEPGITNNFTYILQHGSAAVHKFCISAIGKNKTEGALSDTVSVPTPSFDLPQPILTDIATDSSRAVIRWQYPAISDLRGFRVFENDNVIATEHDLSKNTREFTTQNLERGASYAFKIMAIAENGAISEYSVTQSFSIPKAGK